MASALLGVARSQLALHAAAGVTPLIERAQAIIAAQGDVGELADVRFLLAQGLWSAPGSSADRTRALDLAEQAREAYAKAGGHSASRDLAEVTAWLAARR